MHLSKIRQAFQIMDDLDIDMWMIFARETDMFKDPSLDLVVGEDISGKGAFIFHRSGHSTAYLWKFDAANIERLKVFDAVKTYTDDFKSQFLDIISAYHPKNIALNYSQNSSTYDGITHGMYLKLLHYLSNTPYKDTIISAEALQLQLRGIKTVDEINRLKIAAQKADKAWHDTLKDLRPGMSEKEIAAYLKKNLSALGCPISFSPVVNAGMKTPAGHALPTAAPIEKGELLHVDFGGIVDGYCSDIQRVAYFKKDHEKNPPTELTRAFQKVKTIIDEVSQHYKKDAIGVEVDKMAREMLKVDGYPEFQYSLGHQIGRAVHDGGSRVGPRRDENDQSCFIPLEVNNTFTIELGIPVGNIGYVGLEEDLRVTEYGGEFLGPRQEALVVL